MYTKVGMMKKIGFSKALRHIIRINTECGTGKYRWTLSYTDLRKRPFGTLYGRQCWSLRSWRLRPTAGCTRLGFRSARRNATQCTGTCVCPNWRRLPATNEKRIEKNIWKKKPTSAADRPGYDDDGVRYVTLANSQRTICSLPL